MQDETILAAVGGTQSDFFGLRWGEYTRFAVLDIDQKSRYHCSGELRLLQERLAAVELSAKLYRSSDSGGWHVYLFFDNWEKSAEVNELLGCWLRAQSYEIRGGVLELFPSGCGLRLPLQPGFAWLAPDGEVIRTREEITTDEALASFLTDLEENKITWSEAKNRIDAQLAVIDRAIDRDALAHQKAIDIEGLEDIFKYRLIPERYEEGRRYWQTGLTSKGQRHDAIIAVQHYLWHGDQIAGVPAMPAAAYNEARYRLILAWLETKHNGFCNHVNRGKWRKVEQQIRRACLWRRSGFGQVRTPYAMTERAIERLIALYKSTGRVWSMDDLKKGNDGREAQATEKIRAAVQLLNDQGRRVTVRQLMRLTGCCNKTIKRNSHIWAISSVVALPSVGGDKNPFLDLNGVCTVAPCPEKENKENLDPPDLGDSGERRDVASAEQPCELAPIYITPPLDLPGSKPTIEHPTSSPSPAGACGRLDAGSHVRWYSGRAADAAGGLEPKPRTSWTAGVTASPFVISQTYKESDSAKPDLTGCLQLARKPAPCHTGVQTAIRVNDSTIWQGRKDGTRNRGYEQNPGGTGRLRFWSTRGPPCPSSG